MLSGGILKVNTGVDGAYTLEIWILICPHLQMLDLFKQLSSSTKNTAGNGTCVHNDTKVQVHTASQSGVSELAIPVSDSLGDGSLTNDSEEYSVSVETLLTSFISTW